METTRLLELLEAYIENRLSVAEREELQALLMASPEARRTFWEYLQQHSLVGELVAEAKGQAHASRELKGCSASSASVPALQAGRGAVHGTTPSQGVPGVARSQRLRAARSSSRRLRKPGRRWTPWAGQGATSYGLMAAGLLAAISLFMLLRSSPSSGLRNPGDTSRRDEAGRARQAEEELARQAQAVQRAKAEAVRAEAERKLMQERLTVVETARQRLVEEMKKSEEEQHASASREAQRMELERLNVRRREEEERLARAAEAQRNAARELGQAEAARLATVRQHGAAQRPAAELGEIVFVLDFKKEEARPMVVRQEGEVVRRIPLERGGKLLAGDRIECGVAEKASGPVGAALTLHGGTTVDLQAGSAFELLNAGFSRLDHGRLYAQVSSSGDAAMPAPERQVFKTAYADAAASAAHLDLSCDAREAVLHVEEGGATFTNGQGETRLQKLQRSIARKDFAPGPATVVIRSALWRGRSGDSESQAVASPATVLLRYDFEDGRVSKDWIGNLAAGPLRTESRSCLVGVDVPESNLTRVRLGDDVKGLFVYRDGAVLSFDYWAEAKVVALIVYFWDRPRKISLGGHRIAPPSLVKERWGHATVNLGDLRNEGQGPKDGNLIVDLTIQTDDGFGALYIDNVDISVPRSK